MNLFRTESESASLLRRIQHQQTIIEESHRNNSRLREAITKLTLTKSRRNRDAMLAEAMGKLNLYCSGDLA